MTPWNGIVSRPSKEESCIFFLCSLFGCGALSLAPLGAAKEAAFEFMKLPITLMSVGFRSEKWRILSVSAGGGGARSGFLNHY
jgi:hypothetical protein